MYLYTYMIRCAQGAYRLSAGSRHRLEWRSGGLRRARGSGELGQLEKWWISPRNQGFWLEKDGMVAIQIKIFQPQPVVNNCGLKVFQP